MSKNLTSHLSELCKPLTVNTVLATNFSKKYDFKLTAMQKECEVNKCSILQIATLICTGIVTPNPQMVHNNVIGWPHVGTLQQQMLPMTPSVTLPYGHLPYATASRAPLLHAFQPLLPHGGGRTFQPPAHSGFPSFTTQFANVAGQYVSSNRLGSGNQMNPQLPAMQFGRGLMRVPITVYQPVQHMPPGNVQANMMMPI